MLINETLKCTRINWSTTVPEGRFFVLPNSRFNFIFCEALNRKNQFLMIERQAYEITKILRFQVMCFNFSYSFEFFGKFDIS